MATVAETSFLNDPTFLIFIVIGFVVAGLFYAKKSGMLGGKKDEKYTPPETIDVTVEKDLKANMNLHGKGFSLFSPAKLYLGMQELGLIDKYYYGKGKFASYYYDPDSRDYQVEDEEKDVSYELLFIRLKGDSIIAKVLGTGKKYVIVKAKEITEGKDKKKISKDLVVFDPNRRIMMLPRDTHLRKYANIWHNCKEGIEFVNDISIKRMTEVTMTHVQCFPDKVVLFNEEQLRKERLGRIYSEIEGKKWEKRKNAEDTVIE